jgi:hypothetical protein
MSKPLLSGIANVINKQYNIGENSTTNLDADGIRYGALGSFASQIDQTASRSYLENGLINNVRPRVVEAITLTPDITVLVKKRFVSSLANNHKLELMEEKERKLIVASKRLFQNKIKAYNAYERLSKIDNLARETGLFNKNLIPTILQAVSDFGDAVNLTGLDKSVIQTLQRAINFGDTSRFTTWVVDQKSAFASRFGEGTGVFELCNISSLNTKSSVEFGGGNCSFDLLDPYKISFVTEKDIDIAISDVYNFYSTQPLLSLASELPDKIEEAVANLNAERIQRGVSPLSFKVSRETVISKKLRVIIDFDGREVPFSYNSGLIGFNSSVIIDPVATTGFNGLSPGDEEAVKEIIANYFTLFAYESNTQSQIRVFKDDQNYIRNRMRLFYGGQSIIQQMDVVTVFMTTRTLEDNTLAPGFKGFYGQGTQTIGQRLNSVVRDINALALNYSGSKVSPDEVEKNAIAGPNFPTWLWRMFRNDFTRSAAGTCIFSGLVKSVSSSYDPKSGYRLSISCEDNTAYFKKSMVNVQPSLETLSSIVFDPLTPFDISFDATTGIPINDLQQGEVPPLLPENNKLIASGKVKFKSGRNKGLNISEKSYKTKDVEVYFDKYVNVLSDPDGFVYRWKQGIGSITYNTKSLIPNLDGISAPLLNADPFAGQDVINSISLLITGKPYNNNTFAKAAMATANSLSLNNNQSNGNFYQSYIEGLAFELQKRNSVWGNFIPAKSFSVNSNSLSFIMTGLGSFTQANSKLNALLTERARLGTQADAEYVQLKTKEFTRDANTVPDFSEDAITANRQIITDSIKRVDEQIEQLSSEFFKKFENDYASSPLGTLQVFGDDVTFQDGFSDYRSKFSENYENQQQNDIEFRKTINAIALRRLWKTKANEDPNLFIVDDQYDANLDIMAFSKEIADRTNLFNTDYTDISNKIVEVASILGLEVFADTQGNIRVRPPLYNRIPSSVFYRMFQERYSRGVKVFPDFLEKLFYNQVKAETQQIEVIEDEIRLRLTILGADNDQKRTNILRGQTLPSANAESASFQFMTVESTGLVDPEFKKLIANSKPEFREDQERASIDVLEKFKKTVLTQLKSNRIFDSLSKVNLQKTFTNSSARLNVGSVESKFSEIKRRLERTKGIKVPALSDFVQDKRFSQNVISQTDSLAIMNQVSKFVGERQRIIRQLANSLNNLTDGVKTNSQQSSPNAFLTPFITNTPIPKVFEHMIEDETYDEYGPGSGNRYVIKEVQILSIDLEFNEPEFNAIQVNGLFGQDINAGGYAPAANELDFSNGIFSGGNQLVTATSVNYDSWYQFGFRAGQVVQAPFLSNPESQCAPYAVALLNKASKKIRSGSVKIAGYNEYYQPGDVVFLEDWNLLFYVNAVNHNFSYGNLTTTLSLEYGHFPGEYIPTHLDIAGSILYSSQSYASYYKSLRTNDIPGSVSLGAIIAQTASEPIDSILSGPIGNQNLNILMKTLATASGIVNPTALVNRKAVIYLRIYSEIGAVQTGASFIKEWFQNPQQNTPSGILDANKNQQYKINSDNIIIEFVDLNNSQLSPSQAAVGVARNLIDTQAVNNETLFGVIETKVIDMWLVYEAVKETTELSNNGSQKAQAGNAAISSAVKRSV